LNTQDTDLGEHGLYLEYILKFQTEERAHKAKQELNDVCRRGQSTLEAGRRFAAFNHDPYGWIFWGFECDREPSAFHQPRQAEKPPKKHIFSKTSS